MAYIDMHTHTTASDGTDSPVELIDKAYKNHLDAIAITDHDTAAAISEARKRSVIYPDMKFIAGIEMSATYNKKDIHILGYFIDETSKSFNEGLDFFLEKRDERNELILSNLNADNICISREDLYAGNKNTILTRIHFAKALIKKGYASDIPDAFNKYLEYGSRYVPNHKNITIADVMDFFRANNIFSSLAHPIQYKLSHAELTNLVSELKALGLNAIEVYHSSHTDDYSHNLTSLANDFGLLYTGGSDYHGASKPKVALGVGHGNLHIPKKLLTNIEAALLK